MNTTAQLSIPYNEPEPLNSHTEKATFPTQCNRLS